MSQSTFAIPNQSGANYRVAVNNALQALASLYSGTTPSESYAYQLWFDTSTNILKQRNAANNAWVNLWAATLGSPVVINFRDTRVEAHGNNNIDSNTAFGAGALQDNTTGINNTALGINALQKNTTGVNNTAFGLNALQNNLTGINNTAVGQNALRDNNTGTQNTAVGQNALLLNSGGLYNTAVGFQALTNNTTGINNTAVGLNALRDNTIGTQNTAVGANALQTNTIGIQNTAVGQSALLLNSGGIYNTAVGFQALTNNTTGIYNTAVGLNALRDNNTGIYNTVVGANALLLNSGGLYNTAVGQSALQANTTGINNTALGYAAGVSGYGINITTQSNHFILGNSSVTDLICADTSISGHSDARDKKDIEALNFSGLAYINALIPRKFTWDMRKCVGTKKDITEIGFIAQEVESVQSSVYAVPGIVSTYDIDYTDPETDENIVTDQKLVAPAKLIPILVKAIQELSQRLNALEA